MVGTAAFSRAFYFREGESSHGWWLDACLLSASFIKDHHHHQPASQPARPAARLLVDHHHSLHNIHCHTSDTFRIGAHSYIDRDIAAGFASLATMRFDY